MSAEEVNPSVRHERRDINLRALAAILCGGVVGAVLIHGSSAILLQFFEAKHSRRNPPVSALAVADSQNPPPPVLQINPARDLKTLREAERTRLTQYGWIDRGAGEVRIPIERALDLIVERGLPEWKASTNAKKERP